MKWHVPWMPEKTTACITRIAKNRQAPSTVEMDRL
jgi:hypothetical protein